MKTFLFIVASFLILLQFQNCGQQMKTFLSSGKPQLEPLTCLDSDCSSVDTATHQSCFLGDQTVANGQSIVAYEKNEDTVCKTESRVCENGQLTGTYLYTQCREVSASNAAFADCSLGSSTIKHGGVITTYLASVAENLANCKSEVRECKNGVLGGTYNYLSCKVESKKSCLFNKTTLEHGTYVKAYNLNSNGQCEEEIRTCVDGRLTGQFNYTSCENNQKSCSFDGRVIEHGTSVKAFASSSAENRCEEQTRTCNNGLLTGSYQFASCAVNEILKTCQFNGRTLAHGESVVAFKESSVPFSDTCLQETRTCQNGQLSNNYVYASCVKDRPKACLSQGKTIPSGDRIITYTNAKGSATTKCSNLALESLCLDGSFDRDPQLPTCEDLPVNLSCNFNGAVVANGSSVTGWREESVAYGQSCTSASLSCTNGVLSSLSSTYPYSSCTPKAPVSCVYNGVTVKHGDKVGAYSSDVSTSSCIEARLTCSNGTILGINNYPFTSCRQKTANDCGTALGIISDGGTKTVWNYSKIFKGEGTCQSHNVSCSKGALSSYLYAHEAASCTEVERKDCRLPDGSFLKDGESEHLFSTDAVVLSDCSPKLVTCNAGTLSQPGYVNRKCNFSATSGNKPCVLFDKIVSHGDSLKIYSQKAILPSYSEFKTLICNNSVWMSSVQGKTSVHRFLPTDLYTSPDVVAFNDIGKSCGDLKHGYSYVDVDPNNRPTQGGCYFYQVADCWHGKMYRTVSIQGVGTGKIHGLCSDPNRNMDGTLSARLHKLVPNKYVAPPLYYRGVYKTLGNSYSALDIANRSIFYVQSSTAVNPEFYCGLPAAIKSSDPAIPVSSGQSCADAFTALRDSTNWTSSNGVYTNPYSELINPYVSSSGTLLDLMNIRFKRTSTSTELTQITSTTTTTGSKGHSGVGLTSGGAAGSSDDDDDSSAGSSTGGGSNGGSTGGSTGGGRTGGSGSNGGSANGLRDATMTGF